TPFHHTKAFDDMQRDGRILSNNWADYTADRVVFQPKNMSPQKLQEMYYYAWDTFYKDESQQFKMFKLIKNVMKKELGD
ncbi:MAG: DUF4070 domain-containing protein, partial [Spirochaetes bacterium]|nr:DUF4070 domain-containing protein [Spirochaetota bacterium]